MPDKPKREHPPELLILLSRVKDDVLRSDFGVTQKEIDELRLILGLPEPTTRRVDALTFTRIWQRSTSIREVAVECGITVEVARVRERTLRRHKVPLKELASPRDAYWDIIRAAVAAGEEDGNGSTP